MGSKQYTLTDKEVELIKSWSYGKVNKLYKKLDKIENKKPIKISSRKAKGRNLQYWVCTKISELLNIPYNQSDDQCLIHSREMGQHGNDIILRGEALQDFPFSIECKNSESLNLIDTINQVKNNQIEGTYWMIVHKRKGIKNPIVIIDWNTIKVLYSTEFKK